MSTPGATSPIPWSVQVVDETGSTNADLLTAAQAGARDRSVLMALHQTAGRGRLDRRWDAPPGANLLASLLFADVPQDPHVLTQRVALAAAAAVEQLTGRAPELKWPNDLMLDGAKLAGVLAEAATVQGRLVVVVGIGVNIGWAPDGAARLGDSVSPRQLLDALLGAYDSLPADVHELYRTRLATVGRVVRVVLPEDGSVEGRAVGVEPDGRLVVLDECGITHRFAVGDVVHVR